MFGFHNSSEVKEIEYIKIIEISHFGELSNIITIYPIISPK